MAEISEERIKGIEEDIQELKEQYKSMNNTLTEIFKSLVEIKTIIKKDNEIGDKDNKLIEQKVESNTDKIKALEGNQAKIVWAIIGSAVAIVAEAVVYYLQNKP